MMLNEKTVLIKGCQLVTFLKYNRTVLNLLCKYFCELC